MLPEDFIAHLKHAFSKALPGERAHLKAMPVSRPLSSEAKKAALNIYRTAAVSVLLYPHENKVRCILIQRPDYEGVHGGQVAFPGGKIEPEDPSIEYAARRESFEEIGFPIHHGELVGQLTEVFIPVSKFLVHPMVFFTPELPDLIPDAREVDEIIHFDLYSFAKTAIMETSIRVSTGITLQRVPYFPIEDRIVWGATAIMLAEFQEIIQEILGFDR